MHNPTYLQLSRNGIFYFRWPIPRSLHPRKIATTIRTSLRTREPKQALRLSRVLTNLAETVTRDAMTQGMKFGEIRDLLQARFSEKLKDAKRHVYDNGPLTHERIAVVEREIATVDDAVRYDSPLVIGMDEREALTLRADGLGLLIPDDPAEFSMFKGEFKRAYRDFLKAFVAHLRTLDGYEFGLAGVPTVPSSSTPQTSAQTERGITLGALIEGFCAEKRMSKAWGLRTADEKEKHFNLLYELLGAEKDVKAIAVSDAQRIKGVVTSYPKNRFKNSKIKNLTLDEIIARKAANPIDVATANKYIQSYSSLFEWAVNNVYMDKNHFERMVIQKPSSGDGREAFGKAQMQRMIAELTDPNSLLISRDYQRWGSLIGIYTGARLNEIAQLRLDDLKTDSETGIWFFDLNDDGDGKQLKNQASKRRVPVHSQLVALGLPAYIERLRAAGHQRLFPSFTKDLKNGYGRALGRWFNDRFLPKLGLKTTKVSFHSLRHTAITTMMQAGVEEPIVKSVVGHTKSGVTQQHYFKAGYTLGQLRDAIEKIAL